MVTLPTRHHRNASENAISPTTPGPRSPDRQDRTAGSMFDRAAAFGRGSGVATIGLTVSAPAPVRAGRTSRLEGGVTSVMARRTRAAKAGTLHSGLSRTGGVSGWGLECHQPRAGGQPLSRRALGRMGLGAVHKALSKVLQMPIAQAHLGERWTLRTPYPGRPGRDDLFYARWAQRYVEALKAAPAKPVKHLEVTSDEPGVTGDEIRARLRRARERRLLTAAPKGRPGGELTDKANALLREAGLIEKANRWRASTSGQTGAGERGDASTHPDRRSPSTSPGRWTRSGSSSTSSTDC